MLDRRRFRQAVFRVHTWLGLHACLLLAVIFVTGTLLMFSPELTVGARPALWVPPSDKTDHVSFGETYDAVAAGLPGGAVFLVQEAARPWFPRAVYANDEKRRPVVAWVNPADGSLRGVTPRGGLKLRDTVRKLHDSFLLPLGSAQTFVNVMSFVLLTSVITGLISYRRFWKGLFRLPAAGADRRTRQGMWHRTVAVWVAPFLLACALTGAVFFVNSIGFGPVLAKPDATAPRETRLPEGFDGAAVDAAVAAAKEAAPGLVVKIVVLPGSPKADLKVGGYDPEKGEIFGQLTVAIDPVTNRVLGVQRNSDGNGMARIMPLAIAIHYGHFGGLVSVALWAVFGLGSAFLLLTGARVYAARILGPRAAEAGNTLSLVWRGLGVLRWAYALLGLGIVAMLARSVL